MASCYAVDPSMADVYCNLPNISVTQNKTFSSEPNVIDSSNRREVSETSNYYSNSSTDVIDSSNRTDLSETFTNNYYNSPTVVTTTSNLQTTQDTQHHSRSLSDSVKSEFFANVEKTESNRILDDDSPFLSTMSSIKQGDESMPRIFTMDMDVEDSKVLVDDNSDVFGINTTPASEHKIFTMDSVVSEPPTGLQKKPNGNWCCDICGHEELLKDDILTHRILHLSDDHSKQCPICEKKFSSLTSLRNHLTVHTGIKKFHCKYCGRKFGWKTQLAIHENLHTGKGLHHCQICAKSFMTKWLLQRHLKIHLKDSRRSEKLNSSGSSSWVKPGPKTVPQKYENFLGMSPTNGLSSVSIESQTVKLPKCHECDLTFKGEDLLAFHLLEHNSARQKCNVGMRNQSAIDVDTSERNWDVSMENWSSSRYGNEDGPHFADNMEQERLKLNTLKNTSKGSLTSIVSKLHHKVDEKQKSDEPSEVLILKNSHDNHMTSYLKDTSVGIFREGSKQPLSSSSADPFISGIPEAERNRESTLGSSTSSSTSACSTKNGDQHCFVKSPSLLNEHTSSAQNHTSSTQNYTSSTQNHTSSTQNYTPSAQNYTSSTQHESFEKDMKCYFVKQEKELASLQSLVATLHGKVDTLTNIVTSQSLLINRIFLGGKMVVTGNLDFNVRPAINEEK